MHAGEKTALSPTTRKSLHKFYVSSLID
jgi:hypothetical protein